MRKILPPFYVLTCCIGYSQITQNPMKDENYPVKVNIVLSDGTKATVSNTPGTPADPWEYTYANPKTIYAPNKSTASVLLCTTWIHKYEECEVFLITPHKKPIRLQGYGMNNIYYEERGKLLTGIKYMGGGKLFKQTWLTSNGKLIGAKEIKDLQW